MLYPLSYEGFSLIFLGYARRIRPNRLLSPVYRPR